jgi:hypothetical protein
MRFSLIQDGVQSDLGFRILHTNRHGLRYEEQGRALVIPSEEHLDGSIEVYLRQAIRWSSPYEKERLDASRRQMIRFRIKSALVFEGYSPQFDAAPLFAPEGAWSLSGLDANLAIG